MKTPYLESINISSQFFVLQKGKLASCVRVFVCFPVYTADQKVSLLHRGKKGPWPKTEGLQRSRSISLWNHNVQLRSISSKYILGSKQESWEQPKVNSLAKLVPLCLPGQLLDLGTRGLVWCWGHFYVPNVLQHPFTTSVVSNKDVLTNWDRDRPPRFQENRMSPWYQKCK